MSNHFLSIAVFIAAFSAGWFSHQWYSLNQGLDPIDTTSLVETRGHFQSDTDQSVKPIQREGVQPIKPLKKTVLAEGRNTIDEGQGYLATATAPLTLFIKLLEARRYEAAINFYQEQEQYDEQLFNRFRIEFLSHLKTLLKNQDHDGFSELSGWYLSSYYDDVNVLLILAEFDHSIGAFIEAINTYQTALTYAYDEGQQQKVLMTFHKFVEKVDNFYSAKEDWFALLNFYSQIEYSDLMNSTYQYRYAVTNINAGFTNLAINLLESLVEDSNVGERASKRLKGLLGSGDNTVAGFNFEYTQALALRRRGNQFLVDIQLNRIDDVSLLIDTGASLTTLTQEAFDSLVTRNDARFFGKRIFQTANGTITGTVYFFPELSLGSFSIRDTQIAVLDFSMSSGVSGLLGMNVLGKYRFQIDQEASQLLLKTK